MRKKHTLVERIGMTEARLKLRALAKHLAREPDQLIEITRRGQPVLHVIAPPRVDRSTTAARQVLQRIATLEKSERGEPVDVARRYKRLLYGDD